MSTNAKIIFGYKDQFGHWTVEHEFVRWSDGYSEMVLQQLKEFTNTEKGVDVEAFNEAMEEWKKLYTHVGLEVEYYDNLEELDKLYEKKGLKI